VTSRAGSTAGGKIFTKEIRGKKKRQDKRTRKACNIVRYGGTATEIMGDADRERRGCGGYKQSCKTDKYQKGSRLGEKNTSHVPSQLKKKKGRGRGGRKGAPR